MNQKLRVRAQRIVASALVAALGPAMYLVATSGAASAAANKSVSVDGFGTLTCPDSSTTDALIGLDANKFKGSVQGQGQVVNDIISNTITEKDFNVTSGTINTNSFTLQAIVTFDGCNGGLYPSPVNATISGQCGTDVLFTYTDANGETGSFEGRVACT